MDKIRAIVVDDELLARKRIRSFLAGEEDFEIVAECGDGVNAIQAVEELRPDLVFLDIQMPGIDGFEVLESIDTDDFPMVVFVTAHDKYAIKAFEVRALDYLLKPFDEERFSETLDRVREWIGKGRGEHRDKIDDLLGEMGAKRGKLDRLLIKSAGRVFFLPLSRIDWIEAAGNYVRIHAGSEIHLMRESMGGTEEQLPPDRFVRVHRSAIVNLKRIKELLPSVKGEFDIHLRNGKKITLSRKYRPLFEERLGRPI